MKLSLGILPFILLATGCSTYSKKQCLEMDQAQLGYQKGIDGIASFDSVTQDFKKNCEEEHGVLVDGQKVKRGWEDGLRFYCSSNGGMRAGSRGLTYSGVCAKADEKTFFESYNPTRMNYLERNVNELESIIKNMKNEVSFCESDLNSYKSRVTSLESELSSVQTRALNCQ
jgi:hypothetical protein